MDISVTEPTQSVFDSVTPLPLSKELISSSHLYPNPSGCWHSRCRLLSTGSFSLELFCTCSAELCCCSWLLAELCCTTFSLVGGLSCTLHHTISLLWSRVSTFPLSGQLKYTPFFRRGQCSHTGSPISWSQLLAASSRSFIKLVFNCMWDLANFCTHSKEACSSSD